MDVSDVLRAKAADLGDAGQAWLAGLPDLLASIAGRGYTLGELMPGGTAALVIDSVAPTGEACVVKVGVPDEHAWRESIILERAGGRGYARLLESGEGWFALERLGTSLAAAGLSVEEQIAACAAVLADCWRVDPAGLELADGRESARWLADFIETNAALSPDQRIVEEALRCCERRAAAFTDDACVLAHGDPHPANLIAHLDRDGYCYIDPTGLWIDPGYDLGVVWRGWQRELDDSEDPRATAEGWVVLLARLTGVDAASIWDWGFTERVSSGIYLRTLGVEEEGLAYLNATSRLL